MGRDLATVILTGLLSTSGVPSSARPPRQNSTASVLFCPPSMESATVNFFSHGRASVVPSLTHCSSLELAMRAASVVVERRNTSKAIVVKEVVDIACWL